MTENKTITAYSGKIIAMFIDEGVEMLLCLRLCDSDGLYPSVMYRTIQYNEFKPEHEGRTVISVRELPLEELHEPEHDGLLSRICSDFKEPDGDVVCALIRERGGSLFLHTLDGGEEVTIWSMPPITHYAQPRQISYWDVGQTYSSAYIRTDSTPMLDYFQPWRTDSFILRPHGSDHRLYGGVQILDVAQTDYTLRFTVEDDLHRSHRVVYKNWGWNAITEAMIGLSLTLVREISVEELADKSLEAALLDYSREHPGWRSDLSYDVDSGYKLFLHETGDPDTEFLVIAGYIYMT